MLFFSDLDYKLNQFALFGEGTLRADRPVQPHRRPALLPLQRGQARRSSTASSPTTTPARRSCRSPARPTPTAWRRASSRATRLTRRHEPERAGLEGLPARRHQRPAQRAALHAAGPRHLRRPRHLEGRDGLELRGRRQVADHGRHAARSTSSAFYMDINDLQATVTAGSCSSRVIFNVPKARSPGVEVEFDAGAEPTTSTSPSRRSYNDSELRSTLTSTDADGTVSVVSGIESGSAPADRAEVPAGGGRRPTSGRCRPELARLRHRHLPARRLALHAGRRPGASARVEPDLVRRQHDRRPADARPRSPTTRAAGLRHRQPAARRPLQGQVGRRALRATT